MMSKGYANELRRILNYLNKKRSFDAFGYHIEMLPLVQVGDDGIFDPRKKKCLTSCFWPLVSVINPEHR